MRLTLRTLLAYLDDTLEPSEIKQIGQKVAESDAAQELIARIKQITRRRRLTTPPATGPGARFDANDIAEYLDNELDSEKVAELEKTCLESDVHLAEIAACHQILTLVLGEPALVPPTARERMYGLVRGREAIPFRKAAPAAAAAAGADHDGDESFLTGLPLYRRHGTWLRWALPLGAVALFVALGVALWQAIPRPHEPKQVANNGNPPPVVPVQGANPDTNKGPDKVALPEKSKEGNGAAQAKGPEDKGGQPSASDKGKKPGPDGGPDTNVKPPPDTNPPPPTGPQQAERTPPPSTERADLGAYFVAPKSAPTILVRHPAGSDVWQRVAPGARVGSNDALVSLPGYASELRLDSGVQLLLRGNVPEFSVVLLQHFLVESAVALHKPAPGVDVDLTLRRGRIYLSNGKAGPAVVRLRFEKETWDLTLHEAGTEVGVDLFKHYTRDIDYKSGEGPRAELGLCVLKGKAGLKMDTFHYSSLEAPPGPALFLWDNVGPGAQGPIRLDAPLPSWSKDAPKTEPARDMVIALQEQSERMVGTKPLEVALVEGLGPMERPSSRLLAIYSLGAINEVRKLLDILGEGDPAHWPDRDTAIFTLRRWLSRGPEQGRRLYDPKTRGGLLMDMKYQSREAVVILDLLHDFNDVERRSPVTFGLLARYLRNDRVAIAELAWWQLRHLSGGVNLPLFNAAATPEERAKAAADVEKLVKDGKLPPPARPAAPAGPAAGEGGGPGPMPKPRRSGLSGPGVKPGP